MLLTVGAASALMYLFRVPLLSLYLTDSQEAILWGIKRMHYIPCLYFLLGCMDNTTGALRGLGLSLTPMFIALLGACGLRILWIYTIFQIPQFHTPEWLYISYLISWLATFIFQTIAFIVIYKKRVSADKMISTMPEFKGEIP